MKKSSTGGRGVESPNPSDMALIGNTAQELHTKSLPRLVGPNFGYGGPAASDEERVTDGGSEGTA